MIYCPMCGTANRDGSKYCNECGVKFDPRMQKCSHCGAMNPVERLACDACGESLPAQLPLELHRASSRAGEGADSSTSPEHIPAVPNWLQDLPAPAASGVPQDKEPGEETVGLEGPSESPTQEDGAAGLDEGLAAQGLQAPHHAGPVAEDMLLRFLAGLEDGLPAEPLITQTGVIAAGAVSDTGVSPQDAGESAARARLFAEIVTPQQQIRSRATPRAAPSWLHQLPRWLIYALLIAALALPLLLRGSLPARLPGPSLRRILFLDGRTMPASPPVAGLFTQIQTLEADAPVLLAVDYDPSGAEEMDVLAQEIVDHLMDQEARVVAVTLLPAGAATAQELLEMSAAGQLGHAAGYGRRYANLGYLSGQAAAVRLLGESVTTAFPRDFLGNPVADLEIMEGITSLRDFDLIVELAATQGTLRWWIEQGSSPHGVPLGAGVSAAVEPLARPYFETGSPQLVGLVGGVPGAATYQALREAGGPAPEASTDQSSGPSEGATANQAPQTVEGPVAATLAARLDAQLMGFLILVMVILVGNGVYFVRRAAGKEH